MDQGRGLERLPRLLAGQFLCGQLAEFVVDQRQELAGGVRVALFDRREDARDVGHLWRPPGSAITRSWRKHAVRRHSPGGQVLEQACSAHFEETFRHSKTRPPPGPARVPGAGCCVGSGDDRPSRLWRYHGPGGLNGRVRDGNRWGPGRSPRPGRTITVKESCNGASGVDITTRPADTGQAWTGVTTHQSGSDVYYAVVATGSDTIRSSSANRSSIVRSAYVLPSADYQGL